MEIVSIEKVRVEKIVEIFKEQGVNISIEQARLLIEFMSKLAKIAIEQCLSN